MLFFQKYATMFHEFSIALQVLLSVYRNNIPASFDFPCFITNP